jgi:ADP-ribosyl-[dinitrogen reductase] hydrolase
MCAAVRSYDNTMDDAMLLDRIRGSLLGAAVGDALGSAFEFVESAAIERAIGSNIVRDYHAALPGSLLAPRRPGVPTDDTAMTLALVDALAQGGQWTPAEILSGMVDRLARGGGTIAAMFWSGGPGGACVAMLRAAQAGAAPFEQISPQAGGNGAAMRAHPCGAFFDRAFVAEFAAMQARLSHPHPAAVAAAQAVALAVHEAMYDGRFPAEIPPEITDPTMLAAWEWAHAGLRRSTKLPAHLLDVDMAGWNTVAAAHAIAYLHVDEPAMAIGLAAASGEDTDTVASIVGGMLGALHGVRCLPERWLDGLEGRDLIERAAAALYRAVRTS